MIIGAGIVGCSLADELTQRGWTDITVVDQGPLYRTGGSTSHAPGLVFQTNSSKAMTELAAYTVAKFQELGCFNTVGGIEVAATPERWHDLKRKHGLATSWGVESRLISPDDCAERWPLLDPRKIYGGFYAPLDGIAQAVRACEVQAERAIDRGARFLGGHRVTGIDKKHGRVTGVTCARVRGAAPVGAGSEYGGSGSEYGGAEPDGSGPGDVVIPADIVVCAAGFWGPQVGRMAGVTIPLQPLAHQYAWSSPIMSGSLASGPQASGAMSVGAPAPGRTMQDRGWPILRHQDADMYFKLEDGGRIGLGSYAHDPMPVDDPGTSGLRPFTPEDFAPSWGDTVDLLPALAESKVEEGINGVFSFTTDGMPLLGEAPDLKGFWVAEAVWVTHSAGVGRAVADWLVTEHPIMDLHECDLNRFEAVQLTPDFVAERGNQNFIEVYDVIHPSQPMDSPRPLRTSPFYQRQRDLGAYFLEAFGWERPQWFDANAAGAVPGWDEWFMRYRSPISATEARATREGVAIYDMTPLKRMDVKGPGAAAFLQHLTSNNVDKAVGTVTYTLLMQEDGGVRSDLTAARLGEDHYQVAGNGNLDLAHLVRRGKSYGGAPKDVHITDITPGTCCIGLWGPQAKDLVGPLTDDDLAFGYFKCKRISIGNVPVIAMRVSYVGEYGWELYTTSDLGLKLWDILHKAGAVPAGRGAFNSLRLEKGYRAWGTDMTTEHNPFEAGLGFAVRMEKDFIGRAALEGRPVRRRLTCLISDRPVMGKEPVYRDGAPVGYVTSADYGYTIEKAIAYAWLPPELGVPGETVEIEYFGERVPAIVSEEPLFDPKMTKLKPA